ncbi:MAG: cation:proton antiporter [Bacteroidales bacterium]|nr:cation:proton antiporter [Bacteroidales bacterium]
MSSELALVTDLAVILVAAGVFTIISKALKQPLILGYIIAGFIVGPHLGLFPKLTSVESVHQWSEIGIIFLLFALGLEFSFKKLLKVGSSALIVAGTIFIGMFVLGFTAGQAMGWSPMESVFLGGLLPMSSTTIIIKAYEDLGLKNKPFAPLVFGTLVVEDLLAILVMVLLTAIAVSNKFSGGEMLFNLGKLGFFLILWFLVGIFLIPTLLRKSAKWLNDEILLIVSIGLCFGMVAIANLAGFSSALGAFVMGSILAETVEAEKISGLVHGIKDLFGAIFFVSVGMMVDPVVIGQNWGTILILAILAVGGILFFSTTGAVVAGKGLDNSVHTGFSMAQLGEFAFIIAGLGVSLGVMRDFIYPVVIAVSVLTTFTTPYMMKLGDPASRWIAKKLPPKIMAFISHAEERPLSGSAAEQSLWKQLVRSYLLRVILYGVILLAILLASGAWLDGFIAGVFPSWSKTAVASVSLVLTLVVMSPFVYGLGANPGSINKPAVALLKKSDKNRWPILSLVLLRALLATGFVIAAIVSRFELSYWAILLIILSGAALLIVARMFFRKFSRFENRFLENLNEKEAEQRKLKPVTTEVTDKLAGYDIHPEVVVVDADSEYIGKMLKEIPIRAESGVNVVKIARGSRSIVIPDGNESLYPGDRVLAVGSGDQIERVREMIPRTTTPASVSEEDVVVEAYELGPESFLTGRTLKDTDMRSKGCMVISVLRGGSLIANPRPDMEFLSGDTVWLAGRKTSCEWFK